MGPSLRVATMKLHTIDLNLLVVLDALLDERSVTRAGVRLGLSQPATSHALARLRDMLDDPVLVRSGRSMIPTPKAEAMRSRVSALLDEARELVVLGRDFEPSTTKMTFRVAADDYASVTRIPERMVQLAAAAPCATIIVRSMGHGAMLKALVDGEVDVGLRMAAVGAPHPGLSSEALGRDAFVCVVRAGHPGIGASVTLDDYCAVSHVLISPRGDGHGVVDTALAAVGRTRRVGLVLPRFDLAPSIVARTDYLLNMNARYAHAVESRFGLRVLSPPLELPEGELSMVWHPRTDRDQGHAWLRGVLRTQGEAPA